MSEQPGGNGVASFMDRDPLILLSRAAERGEEFAVFIDPSNHGIGRVLFRKKV
jgi:hypothetical protein